MFNTTLTRKGYFCIVPNFKRNIFNILHFKWYFKEPGEMAQRERYLCEPEDLSNLLVSFYSTSVEMTTLFPSFIVLVDLHLCIY